MKNQQSWSRGEKHAVLTDVRGPRRDNDPEGRWEVELTEDFELTDASATTFHVDAEPIISYHRTKIGARYRIWSWLQEPVFEVSRNTVLAFCGVLISVVMFLGILGIRAAYQQVGFNTAGGRIITVAIVVAAISLVVTLRLAHLIRHPKGKA